MEEHIVPESLGNIAYVLPKGIVCDKCNQYFSKLDKYFCHHHLGSGFKLLTKYKTKKGNPPYLPLMSGEMRQDENGKIQFKQGMIEGREHEQFSITFYKDEIKIKANWFLPDSNPKKISRFLAKAGIETLHFKMNEIAFTTDFDFVRKYARFGSRQHFVPFLWTTLLPPQQMIDIRIGTLDSKKEGRFYFGTIVLPGIVYMIPLNRVEEDYGINILKDSLQFSGKPMNLCDIECPIKRDPMELTAHLSNQERVHRVRT